MKTLLSLALLTLAATPSVIAVPAAAQTSGAIAVADLRAAIRKSAAFAAATAQVKVTHAADIAAYDARAKVLQGELQPLADALRTTQASAKPDPATLQAQSRALQTKQQAAQAELQRLAAPFLRAQAYAEEQITAKLDAAVRAAMTAKGVSLVLQPQALVLFTPNTDLTDAIVVELNKAIMTASIVPPVGWQPGGRSASPASSAVKPAADKPKPPR